MARCFLLVSDQQVLIGLVLVSFMADYFVGVDDIGGLFISLSWDKCLEIGLS